MLIYYVCIYEVRYQCELLSVQKGFFIGYQQKMGRDVSFTDYFDASLC